MINNLRRRWLESLAALACLSVAVMSALGDAPTVALASPRDNDHFEVTQPLFFWNSVPSAKSYELYIDDAKVGDVPAAPIPVVHQSAVKPLAVGPHHWFVKAIPAAGDAITSSTLAFTIDPAGNWPAWAIGPFQRYGKNPLLVPQGTTWQSVGTFNPGVVFDQGKFHMLFRAQGKGNYHSREGYAESVDGVTFKQNPDPAIDLTEPWGTRPSSEDARLFKYNGTYYAFYTGSKNNLGGECEATSPDSIHWTPIGPVEMGTKNAAIVCDPNGTPVKINGKFVMYIGNSGFSICYSDDLIHWGPRTNLDLHLPADWVKPYEPCYAVTNYSATRPDDIVLFIAGTLNGKGKWFYAISEVLFSKKDFLTKAAQLDDCIMKPSEPYENGQHPTCLWMQSIIEHDQQWMMYYGAGDRTTALATAPVK